MVEKNEIKTSKGQKIRIRELKREVRDLIFNDSEEQKAWEKTEEILRLKYPNYQVELGAKTSILLDFWRVRREINQTGNHQKQIKEFQERHKADFEDHILREKLIPGIQIIREIIAK